MAFNTQEQEIIRWGVQNGKSRQDVEQAISNFRSGIVPQPKPAQEQPSLASQLGERAKTFGKEALALGTLGVSTMTPQDLNATGQDRSLAALQGLNRAAQSPIRMAGAVGGAIGDVFGAGLEATGLAEPISEALAPVVQSQPVQKAMEVFKSLPQETQDVLGAIVNATNIPIAGAGLKVAGQAIDTGASLLSKTVPESLPKMSLGGSIRETIAKSNASPQLKSSAERLFLEGTQKTTNPLTTYESYLAQSKKALKDIKAEPAISSVGTDIGNAFDKVVKQRQAVGKVMGDELKSVGGVRVPLDNTGFIAQLKDGGLSLNPKTGKLTSFQGTRFAPDEIKMLQSFTDSVLKLGNNPTVSQIDNLIAKTRSELAFTKGKSGVIGTTNAERIINGALRNMKDGLNPATNGIPELTSYWNANKAYEELSNFLEEGQSYLGKKTQTGDFAKDASIAKSSVQSILNNGKKDWLAKLEDLTGDPVLDKSVLALQAMKDAGDFRGTSLLQTLSEGSVPVSKSGLVDKILGFAVTKGGEIVAGTPEEQTRLFLQSLMKSEAKNSTIPTTIKPKAKAGESASKTSQSNSFIQPNSSTKEGVVNELINKPLRGSVTPSEFLPKKKVVSKFENAEDFVRSKGFTIHDRVIDNYSGENIGEIAIRDKNGKAISAIEYGKFGNESPNIKMVVTKPEYQRQGLATALYKRLQELYPDSGVEIGMRTPEGSAFHSNLNKKLADLFETKSGKVSRTPMGMTASPSTTITNDSTKQLGGKKVINTLEQEANKYKSAEEFVKAQGTPIYRGEGGSNVAQGKALLAEGKHFASDSKYPQGFGTVSENIIKPNAKVLDLGDSTFAEISQKLGIPERRYISPKELSTIAKEKGYDVLKYNGEYKSTGKQFTHFVDLTGDSTITKSQLTDIWKKANKNLPEIVKNKNIGDVEIFEGKPTVGDKKGFGLAKIKSDHPEVLPYIEEAFKNAKVVEVLPDRKILEGTSGDKIIRFIVDSKLGKENKTFLNNAYFLKN